MFVKYQHVERLGTTEVDGIELGECYIFPKIDGTNGQVWSEGGELRFASRKRELFAGQSDNAGFRAEMLGDKSVAKLLLDFPELKLCGEWLVPHSLKTYSEDSWRKFYVFDVAKENLDGEEPSLDYLHYKYYQPILEEYGVEYIPPLAIVKNPTYERLVELTKQNNYLMGSPDGIGEGIVIKRYDFVNKYGRTKWAKLVTADFKTKHRKTMGAPEISEKALVEEWIASEYVTKHLVDKVKAKIEVECNGWRSEYIPRLLNTVFHDLITEELWDAIKKKRNPTVNFKTLQHFTNVAVRNHAKDVF